MRVLTLLAVLFVLIFGLTAAFMIFGGDEVAMAIVATPEPAGNPYQRLQEMQLTVVATQPTATDGGLPFGFWLVLVVALGIVTLFALSTFVGTNGLTGLTRELRLSRKAKRRQAQQDAVPSVGSLPVAAAADHGWRVEESMPTLPTGGDMPLALPSRAESHYMDLG